METYESFEARVKPVLSKKDFFRVKLAYMLAKYCHRAQKRMETDGKGEPVRYFEHLRRVALILLDELGCKDPEMVSSALLHDIIEDTKDVDREFLSFCFGAEVADIVAVLSKAPKEGYIQRLLNFYDKRALVVKAADRLDNLRSMYGASEAFRRKQVKETKEHYLPMFAGLIADSQGERRAWANYLYFEIAAQVCAHTAILDGEN